MRSTSGTKLPKANKRRLCLKSQMSRLDRVGSGWVRRRRARFLMFYEPDHYPPATTGGTDPIQEFFCTFEAKPAILKPVMHEFENYAFGVFQSDKNRDFPA